MRTGHRDLIRDLNRVLVLNLVRERPGISRADIARVSGLSPSTVTSITASLLGDALLVEEGTQAGRPAGSAPVGRPATLLRIDAGARHVVGVKLAPESLTATVTDLDATPLAMLTLPHGTHADRSEVIELFRRALAQVLTDAGLGSARPLGIGVGVPGLVHPRSGVVVRSPLPEWVDSHLAITLEEHLGVPVLVDNDVNTLTVAEHLYGAGRGLDHLLVVSIGRGIGMGAVIDGVVARGSRGALGEIGHVVARPGGRRCWCGRRGCLEAVAAEPALVNDVLAVVGRIVAPDELAALAAENERVANILADAGRRVGQAIATATILLDPQRVVVSGEGVRLGSHYLDGLREGLRERMQPDDPPEVVIEPWGDEAWARGAASLVLRELFHPAHLRDHQFAAGAAAAPRSDPQPVVAHPGQGVRRP
jgi:predicted NBD/HSP70 family sugar kinase